MYVYVITLEYFYGFIYIKIIECWTKSAITYPVNCRMKCKIFMLKFNIFHFVCRNLPLYKYSKANDVKILYHCTGLAFKFLCFLNMTIHKFQVMYLLRNILRDNIIIKTDLLWLNKMEEYIMSVIKCNELSLIFLVGSIKLFPYKTCIKFLKAILF